MHARARQSREYEILRQGAGLVSLPSRRLLRLRGKDRARFLHNMLTNDILALHPGEGCQAHKVSPQGKMEAALRVLCLENELWCELEEEALAVVLAGLKRRIVLDDAVLEDVSATSRLLSLQGPMAARPLQELGVDTAVLHAMHRHGPAKVAGYEVCVVRSDHTGEEGYDLWICMDAAQVDASGLPAAEEALMSALVAAGAQPVDAAVWETRRVEAGIPRHGYEITADFFPQEAGLDAGWISYTKGCYLGQETIARIHHLGHVNRCLRGLLFEDGAMPRQGDAVRVHDKTVGVVTSAVHSLGLGRRIALAYVRQENGTPGTSVTVRAAGGTSRSGDAPPAGEQLQDTSHPTGTTAQVTALPFL